MAKRIVPHNHFNTKILLAYFLVVLLVFFVWPRKSVRASLLQLFYKELSWISAYSKVIFPDMSHPSSSLIIMFLLSPHCCPWFSHVHDMIVLIHISFLMGTRFKCLLLSIEVPINTIRSWLKAKAPLFLSLALGRCIKQSPFLSAFYLFCVQNQWTWRIRCLVVSPRRIGATSPLPTLAGIQVNSIRFV